ncbi:YqeG family HAD IIIA-type phosphatase [Periweissella cryptocerci]|uniref:YqeG family HAD IIIA-type phosphatase n=1 Tax=Periweissella cryptocerci TaxID=2506420 RepID=A0A4P6YVJ0_9LACO|nr:YqeG family HAD IIIA-type phosphatase [Periweissella cryptocerci]QBO36763.1 YqeG family HAD IIIA-type phosphatase [Periweissella cryptocerci]
MLNKFAPTWMVDVAYKVTPEQLKAHGIKAVLSDLDNTLIAWNNPEGTPELRAWMDALAQAEIPLVVVSNNSHDRISRAVAPLGLQFVSRAFKPLTRGINQAVKDLGLTKDEVVMVGDQLMTDIWASNNAGVRSILVKPLLETDQWNTRINRFIEKPVKKGMLKGNPELKWMDNIND